MPTVSFYLKNEDYDKWRALDKPAKFVHNALLAETMFTEQGLAIVTENPETINKVKPRSPKKTLSEPHFNFLDKKAKKGKL